MKLYLSSYLFGRDPEEFLRFLDGRSRVAVVANAQDYKTSSERAEKLRKELDVLGALGLNADEVDLREYFGDAVGLEARLRQFDAVWVRGGNAFVLRKAFHYSGADKIIPQLLRSDSILYGGFSAGVCILAPSLHGIELVDDVTATADGYKSDTIWDGLGILPYCVAPHYRSDHYESDAVERTVEYFIAHHIPFVALRDGEVIIIDGDTQGVFV